MKKSLFYFGLASALVTMLAFSGCGNREQIPLSEYAPYITSFTGGLISPSSTIQIELTEAVADAEPNAEVEQKLFSFSPSIKGKAHWLNNRTIEFVPDEGELKSGQSYEAEFKLGKVLEVEKRLKVFYFNFQVEEKNFVIQLNPLDITGSGIVAVNGDVYFSTEMDFEQVRKSISVSSSANQELTPIVKQGSDPKMFHFEIQDIQRQKTASHVTVTVDGNEFGIDKKISEKIDIPELDVFKVMSVELISDPENGVQISFTDMVSTTQDLRGLISISELKNFTYQVKDNKVIIFFNQENISKLTIKVDQGIKNAKGENLDAPFSTEIQVEKLKPQVEMLKTGNIIPTSDNLLLPFRAANLRAVDVKIIQIYDNNVLMFLQDNQLSESNNLKRSGRLVYKKTLKLGDDNSPKLHSWQNYSIDLSKIMKQQPGAIYRIELSFKKEYSVYPCGGSNEATALDNTTKISAGDAITEEEEAYWDTPNPYYYNSYYTDEYNWEDYEWEQRDNPCDPSYFMISHKAACNVMMSNIGVIAKSNSDNKWWISAANILDTKPISGATLTMYNYQLQTIGTEKTDGDGFAVMSPKGKPFILIAESNGQKSYLRLVDGEENAVTRFDVGGKKIDKGLKGFIYGERGVWRPGDTLHISFILHDQEERIPQNHPVSLELYNPRGQFYSKQVLTKSVNGFYTYHIATKASDPTGLWNAYVKIGGTAFHKSLRIETIKPNRLKINLTLGQDIIRAYKSLDIPMTINSSWLTGAIAGDLDVKVGMTLRKTQTQFKGYDKYIFNNPATNFNTSDEEVYEGKLNNEGNLKFTMKTPKAENAPGMLNANIVCRVFEQGGDASIFTQTVPFSPFSSYVGISLNQEEGKYIETDTKHIFDIVTLSPEGRPVSRENLEYRIYQVGWSWWWDSSDNDSYYSYVNSSSHKPVAQGKLKTINGKTSFSFMLKYPDWGRYLVYVVDKESGHATGGTVYIDWPSYRGRSNKTDPNNIKMLTFSTDKKSYEIGEDVTVIIPASSGGNALIALENGSTILDRVWVPISKGSDTKYTFKATKEMAPNFYIHVSMLQPHTQTINDLPIRMYGVIPVMISDKDSYLEPQINMPGVLRPETEFTIQVSEKTGKPMTYTLAIVDEGLLDLTNFKTPNPWTEFFSREALGIRTWDMYDYIMGAFSGKYPMFSIGGDEELKQGDSKANRFKPVVKYLGPFTLDAGKKNAHKIKLPVYVGSVRTMVVAGQNNAYGMTEKATPVRTPLMILSSLPRVISTDEEIMLPVNVFAMENSVKDVSVKIETTGLLQTTDGARKAISFGKPGDQMVYFPMKTGSKTGIERVTITATGGGNTSRETIEIDVRNPNPAIILSDSKLLNQGQATELQYQLSGLSTDDWVKFEASRIPPVDISRRFDFLYNYYHYCSEQLTSRAFPLLYISQFKDLDDSESDMVKQNIRDAIKHLYSRQASTGGIVYWPGNSSADEWITSYAGNFLLVAKEKGYEVNETVLTKWKSYQRRLAQNWAPTSSSEYNQYYLCQSQLLQAYRLYTLALANSPELGAMNRLKESKNLCIQARWRLAAAYAINGKTQAAQELINGATTTIAPYWSRYSYGSSDRDEAMILETMVLMGNMQEAFTQAQKISKNLSRESYFSTQSTAFSLIAMGLMAEKTAGNLNFDWSINGKEQVGVRSMKAIFQKELPKKLGKGKISVTNNEKGVLYVNAVSKYKPIRDTLPAIANNLRLEVTYTDMNGKSINVNNLKQGTDFVAQVRVSNISASTDYTDLALTHIIPSGWEIYNERMINDNSENNGNKTTTAFNYQDIRDDRVLTYFDLNRNRTSIIKIRLQASYVGSFVLPAIQCEAMYDTSAQARTKAGRVNVVK